MFCDLSDAVRRFQSRKLYFQIVLIRYQLFLAVGLPGYFISMLYVLNPAPGIKKKFRDKNEHHGHPQTRCLEPAFAFACVCHDNFSATRNVVLLAMGLAVISSGVGRKPFFTRMRIWRFV